jgi:broad specificity phosphatase PhoE
MQAPPALAQRAVYLVRHAEKDGDALTATGRAQAEKLVCLLKDAGITTIYTTQFERTRQTAAPLKAILEAQGSRVRALSLDLPASLVDHPDDADLITSYGRSVVTTLRDQSPDEIVLIVNHDATVPAIIRSLGHQPKLTIQATEFDRLFQVIPRSAGDTRPPGFFELVHYAQ